MVDSAVDGAYTALTGSRRAAACETVILMPTLTRRRFLERSVRAAAGLTIAGRALEVLADDQALAAVPLPFSKGNRLKDAPFIGEHGEAIGRLTGSGLGGRLAFDLSRLRPDRLIVPNRKFFIRTRYPRLLDSDEPWRIRLRGFEDPRSELLLDDLAPLVRSMGPHLIECSGNSSWRHFGLISAAEWSGAPLVQVLAQLGLPRRAKRALVSGFDPHSRRRRRDSKAGASWAFTLDQLEAAGAFLATRMNGEPLPKDHGRPVRLVMPGWYGCTCIKWVDEIAIVDDDVRATGQMREFAGRTHQKGTPRRARDYRPAEMDLAAMPVRVERWRVDGKIVCRIVGILWGGDRTTDKLAIDIDEHGRAPVDDCDHSNNTTWTLWTHTWRPKRPGRYRIAMRVDDPAIRTRRLDRGYYVRTVEVDPV
jgi:DMSO/TMAO reductase YedYZ molybdopterin-dependent catalytic subunit